MQAKQLTHETRPDSSAAPESAPVPGRRRAPGDGIVRCKLVADATPSAERMDELAAEGTRGSGGALPFQDQIQSAFGRHDVSNIHTHTGADAARTADAMGAHAYAVGDHVVLGQGVSLHTVAHEAAHVIQQRAGVHCKRSGGDAGDPDEQLADEVADRVVAGRSAEDLLDRIAGGGGGGGSATVQRKAMLLKGRVPLKSAKDLAAYEKLDEDQRKAIDRVCQADDYELQFSDEDHVVAWLNNKASILPRKVRLDQEPVATEDDNGKDEEVDNGKEIEQDEAEQDETPENAMMAPAFKVRSKYGFHRTGSFDRQTSTGFLHVPTTKTHEDLQKDAGNHLKEMGKQSYVVPAMAKPKNKDPYPTSGQAPMITQGANAIALGIDIHYEVGNDKKQWSTKIDRVWNSGTHQPRQLEDRDVAEDVSPDINEFLDKMRDKDKKELIFQGTIPNKVSDHAEAFAHSEVAAAADPELDAKLEAAVISFVKASGADGTQALNIREILLNVASNPNAMCDNMCPDAVQDIRARLWRIAAKHVQGVPQVNVKAPGSDVVVSGLREFGKVNSNEVWDQRLDDAKLAPTEQKFPSAALVPPDHTVSIETFSAAETANKIKASKVKRGGKKGQLTKALKSQPKCTNNDQVFNLALDQSDALLAQLDGVDLTDTETVRGIVNAQLNVNASNDAIEGVLKLIAAEPPTKKQKKKTVSDDRQHMTD